MLRAIMPKSLFARTLIIIVAPVIVVQLIIGAVFYDRHLEAVMRRLAQSVAGDIAYIHETAARADSETARRQLFQQISRWMQMGVAYDPDGKLPAQDYLVGSDLLERALIETFEKYLPYPHRIQFRPELNSYFIFVEAGRGGVVRYNVLLRRFTSSTAHIMFYWVVASTLLVLAVAILFMRNQVKPIRRLAEAAERFGKGQDVPNFKPAGATEVRQAAAAFLEMRERIERQIRQRTEMLAGVSHDLRTPLTRLRLQLELMGDRPERAAMKADVEAMAHMIDGYLAFARGAQGETPVVTDLGDLLSEVVEEARRQGADIAFEADGDMVAELRPQALKRCFTNLIDNARRHARHTKVAAARQAESILITVDDDGPGIPPAQRHEVFRPFRRLDTSRNLDTGGVGLGLAIARDAVRSHGGDVTLGEAPMGGLRAVVRLPV